MFFKAVVQARSSIVKCKKIKFINVLKVILSSKIMAIKALFCHIKLITQDFNDKILPSKQRNIGSMLNESDFFEFQDSFAIIRYIRVFRVLGSFQYLMFWVLTNSDIFVPESFKPLDASQELSRSYCLNSLLILQSEFKRLQTVIVYLLFVICQMFQQNFY